MKIHCPGCQAPVSPKARKCRHCKEPLTLDGQVGRFIAKWKFGPLVQCANPICGKISPLLLEKCLSCGGDLLMVEGIEADGNLPGFFGDTKTEKMQILQRSYLYVSIGVLLGTLKFVRAVDQDTWLNHALVTIAYLAILAFLIRWFIPRHIFVLVAQNTTWVMKLAFVFNYFAFLCALQIVIQSWWVQTATLAGIVAITWGSAYFICHYCWGLSGNLGEFFFGSRNSGFNPDSDQGNGASLN